MDDVIPRLVAGALGLLLVWSGLVKLAGHAQFTAVVYGWGIVPRRFVAALAWGLPQLESSLGSVSLWAAAWDQRVSFALAAQAMLFAAFVLTQVLIRARRPRAECGCFRAGDAITLQTVFRSGLLAAFATLSVASR